MKKILIVALLLAVFITTAIAQVPPQWAAPRPQVFASVQPTVIRYKTDFHVDEWNPGAKQTNIQFSAVGLLPDVGLARYTLTPGFNAEETFTPVKYLKVADVEWKTSKDTTLKPVTLTLSAQTFSRVTVEPFTRYPFLRPAVGIEVTRFLVSAQGDSGGKVVIPWESFDRTFFGLGAVWDMQPLSARVLVGPDYRFIEANLFQRINSWATLGVSYQFRQFSFQSGLKVRGDGFGIFGEARF